MYLEIYLIFGIAVVIGVALGILESPIGKGWLGEMIVRFVLGKTAEGEKYVVNDLRLHIDEGKTSQIDHVFINNKGVFVIETKNYSGRIYGDESRLEWTQVLKYGKIKNKLYNPIRQNKTHIYHIANILPEGTPLKSAIVFIQGNTKYIDAKNVFSPFELKSYVNEGDVVLSNEQMEEIYNALVNANDKKISNREHVENIQKMKNDIENNVCPRCGKKLVVRKSKNGEFMGCSGYPECKFTKKI